MKKSYLFTMSVAFLFGGIGTTLWLLFNIKAGAVLVMIALLMGSAASLMRPSNRRIGVFDFMMKKKDQR